MSKFKNLNNHLINKNIPDWFEYFIISIIIINSILIGIETYRFDVKIAFIQNVCLWIFTIEIIIRFAFRDRNKNFFKHGWNIFDIILVGINYIPIEIFENSSYLFGLRVLRAFRVLRLLKTTDEIELIISAIRKSVKILGYNALFFMISIYLFAIIGVSLFKLPKPIDEKTSQKLEKYYEIAPNTPSCSPDPYDSLGESVFTLFRILTGEDWTDIRYNLIIAKKMGLISVPQFFITSYHVVWFIISVYLFTNLIIGAIVTNYQEVVNEKRNKLKK